MEQSLLALMMLSLFLGSIFWLLFLWAARRGDFEDIERPKYRMLEDDDIPPPGTGSDRDGA